MNSTKWSVCRAFLDKTETKESLLSFLSQEQKTIMTSLPPCSFDLSVGFDQVEQLLDWTHYSWFAPFLRTLAENEISLFLSAFSKEKAKELSDHLLLSSPIPERPLPIKIFAKKQLIGTLLANNPELPPIEQLPPSPLSALLDLPFSYFSLLIDFLGLYDLAVEMRLIIDTIKIKKIQASLSKEKLLLLSLISRRQDPSLFEQLEPKIAEVNKEEIPAVLRKKGINRLAKVLYSEDPNFVEYMKMRMSADECALFSSLYKNPRNSKTYKILTGQIMDILAFFKKNNIQAEV